MDAAAREAVNVLAVLVGCTFLVACDARPDTPPARGAAPPVPPRRAPSAGLPTASASAVAPGAPAAPRPEPALPPPLAAPSDVIAIGVDGFRDAELYVPRGATARRPLVVALHGNYDRPEWQCDEWRKIAGGYPFILCPRGIPRSDAPKGEDRWTYGTLARLERELDAGIDAARRRFPDYVDVDPVIFTGFSLGAILGRFIVQKHPERFPRAVFVEGGNAGWSSAVAKRYRAGGGVRVLFACGQSVCVGPSQASARILERAGVEARVVHGAFVGHTYDGPVADAIAGVWPWLVEGDARYPANNPSTPSTSASSRAGSAPIPPR